jgi:16S rRNA U516 pseudouridylate synthase RsuA-like enzyme
VSYFKAKEVRHTLGAGTAHAGAQEVCIEIFVPEGRPHVLAHMLEAQGAPVLVMVNNDLN